MLGRFLIIFFLLSNNYLYAQPNEDCYLYSLAENEYDLYYELLNNGYTINNSIYAVASSDSSNLELVRYVLQNYYGIDDERTSDNITGCAGYFNGIKYDKKSLIDLINNAINMNFGFSC